MPREAFERLAHGPWSALKNEAVREGWAQEFGSRTSARHPGNGRALVYQGRPNEVWLIAQGW